jgi:hypothetical protein
MRASHKALAQSASAGSAGCFGRPQSRGLAPRQPARSTTPFGRTPDPRVVLGLRELESETAARRTGPDWFAPQTRRRRTASVTNRVRADQAGGRSGPSLWSDVAVDSPRPGPRGGGRQLSLGGGLDGDPSRVSGSAEHLLVAPTCRRGSACSTSPELDRSRAAGIGSRTRRGTRRACLRAAVRTVGHAEHRMGGDLVEADPEAEVRLRGGSTPRRTGRGLGVNDGELRPRADVGIGRYVLAELQSRWARGGRTIEPAVMPSMGWARSSASAEPSTHMGSAALAPRRGPPGSFLRCKRAGQLSNQADR